MENTSTVSTSFARFANHYDVPAGKTESVCMVGETCAFFFSSAYIKHISHGKTRLCSVSLTSEPVMRLPLNLDNAPSEIDKVLSKSILPTS